MRKKLAFILGIRPDIIRASLIVNYLKEEEEIDTTFIWSGQHYSHNLKDIFFRELDVIRPDIEISCKGSNDAEIVSTLIAKLYKVFNEIKPDAVVYLGDTNTVVSCLAASMLNIPIIHIEGCMRSHDWRMPEEKYRTMIDHQADLIYAYFDEYKKEGIREGINPENIIVVGNPIVDILNDFYFKKKDKFKKLASPEFFKQRKIEKAQYYLMTCHRRENVHDIKSLRSIFELAGAINYPVYFPASYRTQKVIKETNLKLPKNLITVDPIGYQEFIVLMVNSRGVLTDSGTVVEETCILQVPSVQMRKSTERPQVYDVKSSVKFDPSMPEKYPADVILKKLEKLQGTSWAHNLGDGQTSQRIANDLINRIKSNKLNGHLPENYHLPIERSYREDGL